MTRNNKLIKISVSGKVSEIDEEQEREETKGRMHSGYFLPVPERWDHDRKFRLSMTMLDIFEPLDSLNIKATALFNMLRSRKVSHAIICGDVYISNETFDDIIDFTMDDLKYILDKVQNDDRFPCNCNTII